MESKSPSATVKDIESQIRRILRSIDPLKLDRKSREQLADLQQSLIDARIYTSGYELSETREEQLDNAKQAKRYLEIARNEILSASQEDVFNAMDVAQLTATIDHVKAALE